MINRLGYQKFSFDKNLHRFMFSQQIKQKPMNNSCSERKVTIRNKIRIQMACKSCRTSLAALRQLPLSLGRRWTRQIMQPSGRRGQGPGGARWQFPTQRLSRYRNAFTQCESPLQVMRVNTAQANYLNLGLHLLLVDQFSPKVY